MISTHPRRWLSVLVSISSFIAMVSLQLPVAAQDSPEGEFAPRRVLVGARHGQRPEAVDSLRGRGGRVLSFNAAADLYVVEIPQGDTPAEWARSLRGRSGIKFAEPDFLLHASDVFPTDPNWGNLWGMMKIAMPRAWDTGLGGNTGSTNITAGVIDTGVDYDHPDLRDQMWQNPGETGLDAAGINKQTNNADDDSNGFVDDIYGLDCANDDADPLDDNGHGTHVSGTVGASANNGTGVAGAAWQIRIMALKFLDDSGNGYMSDAIECIDYGISKGVTFTNNSWGGVDASNALSEAIERARLANQLFFAAAGNKDKNNDSTGFYPATYPHDNIVSVAATTTSDSLASFSNYGASTVDIGAPGVSILSTLPNNSYGSWSGTSMATPHVAGAAALLISKAGLNADYRTIRGSLLGSVEPISALSGKVATGGRLNVGGALLDGLSVTASPTSVVIEPGGGTLTTGDAGSLNADDNRYLRIRASSSTGSSWYASFSGIPSDASNLKFTYKGKNSRTALQTISVWNFQTSQWTQLDSRSVSKSEIQLSNLGPADSSTSYVSPTGEVRVQVRSSRSSSFDVYADLMKATYTPS